MNFIKIGNYWPNVCVAESFPTHTHTYTHNETNKHPARNEDQSNDKNKTNKKREQAQAKPLKVVLLQALILKSILLNK